MKIFRTRSPHFKGEVADIEVNLTAKTPKGARFKGSVHRLTRNPKICIFRNHIKVQTLPRNEFLLCFTSKLTIPPFKSYLLVHQLVPVDS